MDGSVRAIEVVSITGCGVGRREAIGSRVAILQTRDTFTIMSLIPGSRANYKPGCKRAGRPLVRGDANNGKARSGSCDVFLKNWMKRTRGPRADQSRIAALDSA